MELTSKSFEEVTFGAKVRGYDPAEVDEFLAAGKEYIAELEDRLRRVTERAARAEQQLDSGGSGLGAAEIGKVWERAAAAAEAAVDEARTEAQRILADARYHADMQLGDARRQADTLVEQAREDAARISAESQSQLRAEINQLEQTREQLRTDVHELSSYADAELVRVRTTLTNALDAIDAHANGETAPPESLGEPAAVVVPPLPQVQEDSYTDDAQYDANDGFDANASEYDNAQSFGDNQQQDDWAFAQPAAQPVQDEWNSESTDADQDWATGTNNDVYAGFGQNETGARFDDDSANRFDNDSYGLNDGDAYTGNGAGNGFAAADNGFTAADNGFGGESQSQGYNDTNGSYSMNADYDNGYDNQQANGFGNQDGYADNSEDESDPFLAELRRAVQDDNPLGPRESAQGQEEDATSINRLYSPEDDADDRTGFFRRKK